MSTSRLTSIIWSIQLKTKSRQGISSFPVVLGNMAMLEVLKLEGYDFSLTRSWEALGMLRELRHLALNAVKINSYTPSSISQLANLELLQLSGCWLKGQIPPSLFTIEKLSVLNLGRNQLSGSIPYETIRSQHVAPFPSCRIVSSMERIV
jgi:hypothetical protein